MGNGAMAVGPQLPRPSSTLPNFALALRAGLFLRADEQTISRFEAEGSKPFQYQTRAKTVTVNSYWQLPARLFDDSEELPRRSARRCASDRRDARRRSR